MPFTETNKLKFSPLHGLILGAGGILLLLITFLGDRTVLQSKKKASINTEAAVSTEVLVPPFSSEQIQGIEKQLKTKLERLELPSQKMETLDALVSLGMSNDRPDIAAQYSSQLQQLDSSEAVKTRGAMLKKQAADLYENIDSMRFAHWNNEALLAYEQLYSQNSTNLDIHLEYLIRKIKSANQENLMSSIQEIRSLADNNPDFLRAQLQLGLLSLQSNQLEKARDRFKKILSKDPTDEWALYYMSELYQRINQPDSVAWYQKEASRVVKDPKLKAKLQAKH